MFADKIVNLNYESDEPDKYALLKFLRERLKRQVKVELTQKREDSTEGNR
jgi:hypothetical protein